MKQKLFQKTCPIKELLSKPAWPTFLALLAAGFLMLSLARLYASNLGTLALTMVFGPLALCAVGLVIFYTKLLCQGEFRLLIGILAVVFLSSAINEKFYGTFTDNINDLLMLTAELFVCYALCACLPKERRAATLNGLIDVGAAVVGIVALVGVILATMGLYVRPAFLPQYGIGLGPAGVVMGVDGRLVLFTHPNSAGMICEVVLLLSVYRILTAKGRLTKWLHGTVAVICFAALALAASRTATIATALGLALYGFRMVYNQYKTKGWLFRWALSLGCAVIVLVGTYFINTALCNGLLSFLPDNALSEAVETAANRNILEDMGMFTGRTKIWTGALAAMTDTPRLFLTGASPINVGLVVSPYSPIYAQELHNSFMQMLVSGGVLCPLLFFAFLAWLCVHSLRLYFTSPGLMRAKRVGLAAAQGDAIPGAGYLPIPIVAILVNACMETFLLIYPQPVFAGLWFFLLAGFVVCADREALS